MQPPRLALLPEDSSDLTVARAVSLLISVCSDCALSPASKYGALSLLVGASRQSQCLQETPTRARQQQRRRVQANNADACMKRVAPARCFLLPLRVVVFAFRR
jgi:hypothetical protein